MDLYEDRRDIVEIHHYTFVCQPSRAEPNLAEPSVAHAPSRSIVDADADADANVHADRGWCAKDTYAMCLRACIQDLLLASTST